MVNGKLLGGFAYRARGILAAILLLLLIAPFGWALAAHAEESPNDSGSFEWRIDFEQPSGSWDQDSRYLSWIGAFETEQNLNAYLECDNAWLAENFENQGQSSKCDPGRNNGYCRDGSCMGVASGAEPITFTLYAIGQDFTGIRTNCDGRNLNPEELVACIQSVGCYSKFISENNFSTQCPMEVFDNLGTITIDPADFGQAPANPEPTESVNPAESPNGSGNESGQGPADGELFAGNSQLEFAIQPVLAAVNSFFFSAEQNIFVPSIFKDLPTFDSPIRLARDVGFSSGVAAVLIVLVLLPTRLINSTIEANSSLLYGWARTLMRRRDSEALASARPKSKRWIPKALLVIFLASIITGFADPDFGFNAMSLRMVVVLFCSFAVVNVIGIIATWQIVKRREGAELPDVSAKFSYLLLIVLTVVFSRILNLNPVIVFGIVLVVEAARVSNKAARELEALNGRAAFLSSLFSMGLGVLVWLVYAYLNSSSAAPALWQLSLREFLAATTIEALATLPILLLPMAFLPGSDLFKWSKWRWLVAAVLSLTLFVLVLVPLPDAWAQIDGSLISWLIGLGSYALFAVVFWAIFLLINRRRAPVEK